MTDVLTWQVEYTDGTFVSELDSIGQEHGWSEVDAGRVRAVLVRHIDTGTVYGAAVPQGATAFFFRRRATRVDAPDSTVTVATCYGWDFNGVKTYCWVADTGAVLISAVDAYDLI